MSTWNQPQWGGNTQPGTIDDQPPFPEIYLRNFVNDLGILPGEATPLMNIIDMFTLQAGQFQVTLSQVPSQNNVPQVYLNGALKTPTTDYSINSRTVTFPQESVNTDDKVLARYSSEN